MEGRKMGQPRRLRSAGSDLGGQLLADSAKIQEHGEVDYVENFQESGEIRIEK